MTTDSNASGGVTQRVTSLVGSRIATYLILGGVLLFLVPEPITSVLGLIVLVIGLVAWIVG